MLAYAGGLDGSNPPAIAPLKPERQFTARDLFSLEVASDPQISPDGRSIA